MLINNQGYELQTRDGAQIPADIMPALMLRREAISEGYTVDEYAQISDDDNRELLAHAAAYFKDGYRLRFTDDAPVGASHTISVPEQALMWQYQDGFYVANSERCCYAYIVKVK